MPKDDTSTPKRNWTMNEFCDEYRCSRDTLLRHIKAGKIKVIRFGSKRLIPATEVQRITEHGL